MKLKSFCTAKGTIICTKRQGKGWGGVGNHCQLCITHSLPINTQKTFSEQWNQRDDGSAVLPEDPGLVPNPPGNSQGIHHPLWSPEALHAHSVEKHAGRTQTHKIIIMIYTIF